MPPERSCTATNAKGEPCGAPESIVDPETGKCPAHREGARERLREAGRKGGKALARKHRGGGLDEDELPPLTSARAAERWLEAVGRAVATGRLGHNEGRTVVKAVREFLRAHEAGQVSDRVERLLEALETWQETGDERRVLDVIEGGQG